MSDNTQCFSVLGAGSWGTALAIQLARTGHKTLLWTHRAEHAQAMREQRCNQRFIADVSFPENLIIEDNLERCLAQANDILVVVPSHTFRATMLKVKPLLAAHRIAWGTKGLEPGTRKLLHQIVNEELGITIPTAAVSGPTFATEVAKGLPGAITVASKDQQFACDLASALHSDHFLTYTSDDIIGVEIGGAVKNVLAIATGIADGMGFGTNTRAAIITRGLNEIMRLGVALGGKRETFMGLSGLGDLVLTCSDDQSRNRRFGLALGRGQSISEAEASVGQVVEGIGTAKTVAYLAEDYKIDMPIAKQVYRILHEGASPQSALSTLMNHQPKPEIG